MGEVPELSEENVSQSHASIKKGYNEEALKKDLVVKAYQRIDQVELSRAGLAHKSELAADNGAMKAAL